MTLADRWRGPVAPLALALLGTLFFVPLLGAVHLFDWDEINFAEAAREMIVTGDYARVQIDYEPFWEKPPLFLWLQALSMHLFGVNEFAARFPNAICGIATLIALDRVGSRLRGPRFGLTWALAHFGSILPFVYFKSGIIDPWFNLFMFLAVVFIAETVVTTDDPAGRLDVVVRPRSWSSLLAGLFIGLAILTKGPVGLLLPLLTFLVFVTTHRFRVRVRLDDVACCAFIAFLVSSLWYLPETIANGPWFLETFLLYQLSLLFEPGAGHAQPFYYHALVLLFGCFPMSVLALRSMRPGVRRASPAPRTPAEVFPRWMIILFFVVLVVFSLARTKIVHYSSLAWFPLSFLAATHLHRLESGELRWSRLWSWALGSVGLLVSLALAAVPLAGLFRDEVISLVRDEFTAGCLEADVTWSPLLMLPGPIYFACVLLALRYLRTGRTARGAHVLFFSTPVVLFVALATIAPRIEAITQGAPIAFYEAHRDESVDIAVIGFKSYAHLFYGRREPPGLPDESKLLHGRIFRPVYFVTKNKKAHKYRSLPGLTELMEKNGFVFFLRQP